jgi:PAS domain S-box-containing protein
MEQPARGLIFDQSLDAVITIDIEGRITGWNPQAEAIFGWSRVEALGRRLSETIIPDAYRDAHERGVARFRATGEGPALDRRLQLIGRRRDGTEFPVELAITAIRVDGATAFSAFVRDLTVRPPREDDRGRTEATFRRLFDEHPLPMWVYDPATLSFLEVNAAAVAQYGYSRDEFLRMHITDVRPPDEVPRMREIVSQFAGDDGDRTWTVTHRFRDGRDRQVDVVTRGIDFAGRPARLVVPVDVTELKRAEAALATYTERLKILHQIDAAIIGAQAPQEIAEAALLPLRDLLGVPRAIVNLFDFETGEAEWLAAIGRRRTHVGPGIRFPLALMGDVEALRRGELQVVDTRAQAPSAAVDALLASGVHVYMVVPMIAGGELIGGISFGGAPGEFSAAQIDIAREVAAQMAIAITHARLYERVKRQADDLEVRVRDRTLALSAANAQLEREIGERRRAENDADRANRAKSDFLSRMSHELRTPLNAILGFGQLLEARVQHPRDRESVEQILRGGRHLLNLINEVLDISRIESGRLSLSPEPVSLGEAITHVVDLTGPLATERGIDVEAAGAVDDDRFVRADAQRLRQVLLNLVSNGIKYNREAGRLVLAVQDVDARRLRITVRDTGPGIPAALQPRLFTPFDRLGAEAQGVEGTGLGLALSKRLVEAMGGALGFESREGDGTTFWVELPSSDAPRARHVAREPADDADARAAERQGTVLYVEDNPSNLRLVERVLAEHSAFRLISAMQGRLGLTLAREHRPDAILLDLHLPDMSGADLLHELRSDPQLRQTPVIMLSADATPGQIQRLLDAGAQAYLTKPLDVPQLLSALDALRSGG